MIKIRFYFTLLLCFSCFGVFAGSDVKSVTFNGVEDTDNNEENDDPTLIIPFSLAESPDGYLCDATLFINLNTASLYTNIRIEKKGEGIISNKWLSHNADKVVDYDLSMYGSGEYTVTISFSNGETYEAVFDIE